MAFSGFAHPLYYSWDCPGSDNPASQNNFPIVKTILSVPFSLIHNLPRLCAIMTYTPFQQQLIVKSLEIMYLWWWDPSLDEIRDPEGCCHKLTK